jgi:hypothetical protein
MGGRTRKEKLARESSGVEGALTLAMKESTLVAR